MTLFAANLNPATGQMLLALLLAACGFVFLLPQPRGRSVAGGIAALIAAAAVFGAWLQESFGKPLPDMIGTVLFYFFASGALGSGCVLVVQRNPARGAIAFAFVILSTCGLFLLLAAPFLMAATVIIYAGAIVVTFLFVLMLSHQDVVSDENDRSREPLLGSLAGFAFVGLVLFTLYQEHLPTAKLPPLPAQVITPHEQVQLDAVAAQLAELQAKLHSESKPTSEELTAQLTKIEVELGNVVGLPPTNQLGFEDDGSLMRRLQIRVKDAQGERKEEADPQAAAVLARSVALRDLAYTTFRDLENQPPLTSDANREAALRSLLALRNEVRLLSTAGDLPARNVGNLGLVMYSEYLLAVELAGTLLLVATIGAITIAHRKGARA